jgi:hypothetical protein
MTQITEVGWNGVDERNLKKVIALTEGTREPSRSGKGIISGVNHGMQVSETDSHNLIWMVGFLETEDSLSWGENALRLKT